MMAAPNELGRELYLLGYSLGMEAEAWSYAGFALAWNLGIAAVLQLAAVRS